MPFSYGQATMCAHCSLTKIGELFTVCYEHFADIHTIKSIEWFETLECYLPLDELVTAMYKALPIDAKIFMCVEIAKDYGIELSGLDDYLDSYNIASRITVKWEQVLTMFTFKYYPSDYDSKRVCKVDNHFKRIGSSSAYYEHLNYEGNPQNNALEKQYVYDKWVLWSYETPILFISVSTDTEPTTDYAMHMNIHVNESAWNISKTTIRHINRFFDIVNRYYNWGYGLSYYQLKTVMLSNHMKFSGSWIDSKSDIEMHNYSSLKWCRVAYFKTTPNAFLEFLNNDDRYHAPYGRWLHD